MFPKPQNSVSVKQPQIEYSDSSDIYSTNMLLREKETERFTIWGLQSRGEVISGIQLIGYILCALQVAVFLINGDQNYIYNKDGIILGVYLGTLTIGLISSVILFHGLHTKTPALLSMWLNTTKINIFIWSAALIVFPRRLPLILLQTKGRERDGQEFENDVIIFNGVLWSLSIGFQIFCCWAISAHQEEFVYTASLGLDHEMGNAKELEALGCQGA